MDLEDSRPAIKRETVLGEDISRFSVEDLKQRLEQLDGERQRVEREIAARQSSRSVADSFFKT